MPRARKKTEVRTDAAMTETPDVFDEAIDARQEPFTAVLDQPARAGGDLADRAAPRCIANPSGTRREPPPGELHERSRRRDSAIMTDAVAGTRLYSNHATHAMAIIFEDKPSEAVRGMLKGSGLQMEAGGEGMGEAAVGLRVAHPRPHAGRARLPGDRRPRLRGEGRGPGPLKQHGSMSSATRVGDVCGPSAILRPAGCRGHGSGRAALLPPFDPRLRRDDALLGVARRVHLGGRWPIRASPSSSLGEPAGPRSRLRIFPVPDPDRERLLPRVVPAHERRACLAPCHPDDARFTG